MLATVDITQYKQFETVCDCFVCQSACKRIICWGTPEEMKKIIDAGYQDRLMLDCFYAESNIPLLAPAKKGHEGIETPDDRAGECTFYSQITGLCEIHDLKPIEGRIAKGCAYRPDAEKAFNELHFDIIPEMWASEKGKQLIAEWKKNVFK